MNDSLPSPIAAAAADASESKQATPENASLQTAAAPLPEERPHHPTSPSSLQSLAGCGYYVSRQDTKPHVRTVAGTKAHNAADKEQDDETLSDEDAAAVAECLDYVADRKQELIEYAFQCRKDADEVIRKQQTNIELSNPDDFEGSVLEVNEPYLPVDDEKFTIGKFTFDATTAGYVDKIILSHDRKLAHVIDYKFGMWPVTHARENLQGIAYALGVFKKWKTVQAIIVHFLQPHLDSITAAKFTRADIPEMYFKVCAVAARAREARLEVAKEEAAGGNPSFSGAVCHAPLCSFCGNLGKCPKALAIAIKTGNKFYPVEVPDDITPTKILDPHSTDLAMRLAMVVSTWASSFRNVITNRVIAGQADVPEGFTIVSQAKRELVDMAGYRKQAIKIIGAKAFEETLQTTFGAVEEKVAEKAPRGLKKKIVEQFKRETEESGCVIRGLPVSFLKAVPKKDKE